MVRGSKRIRKRPLYQTDEASYALKVEELDNLEWLSSQGLTDLFYGDESRVSTEPCIPYGWQFKDEDVFMPSAKGKGLNLFGLLSRNNDFLFRTTRGKIDSDFIQELEALAFAISKTTVVVLDNARVHTSKAFQEHCNVWEKRGLLIFYLPPYSPHLNLIETLWRKLKYEWLRPQDYLAQDHLFYAVTQCLASVSDSLSINFSAPKLGLE